MTLRLILTRHAKSEWNNPFDSDHQRPLNARGRRSAPLIGRWLAARGFLPQEALVSDAARTRETWTLLSAELPDAPAPKFDAILYHAPPATMRAVLRAARQPCVIMIGHNPGIAGFAASLVRAQPDHPKFGRYPTCATLIADFDIPDWSQLDWQQGTLRDFITPRELEG